MGKPLLRITDGTATGTVNLLAGTRKNGGFKLVSWIPAVPEPKGGGVWRESPFAPGRQLVFSELGNVIDSFELAATGESQDLTIRDTQELRRLLQKAVDYRVSGWTTEPVWIEARASCETNTRYALIEDYRTPHDGNPYADPFNTQAILGSFDLVLEHAIWQHTAPGVGECIPVDAHQAFCWPNHLEFDGNDDEVDCGSNAALDNLTAGANGFTAEAWIRADGYGDSDFGRIFDKRDVGNGWAFFVTNLVGLGVLIDATTTDAISEIGFDEFFADSLWHFVTMQYDDTGDRKIYIWVDGVAVTSYTTQQAAVDPLLTDAARDLIIGNRTFGDTGFEGGIGWCRFTDTLRYTAGVDFEPPPRCKLPNIDGDTVAVWIYEGQGVTARNLEGTAALDGTITGAAWGCSCGIIYGCSDDTADCDCAASFLDFDGLISNVNCQSPAVFDNLPSDASGLLIDCWIRADGYGGGNLGRMVSKTPWYFSVRNTTGLRALIPAAVQNAETEIELAKFSADGLWHHVQMQYEDGGIDRAIYFWVDGEPSGVYTTQIQAVGALTADAASDLVIGNAIALNRGFDGGIGWVRLRSTTIATGTVFTPPPRCTVPTPDANTVAVFMYEGFGDITYNRVPGDPNNGTINDAWWDCYDCDAACDCDNCTTPDSVYLTNKHTRAQITHIYWNSGVVWSGNLQNVLPSDAKLFDDPPAVNDFVVFISDMSVKNSGPFDSLVFDIITAQGDLTTIDWEYWNGAWVALTVQDNTNANGLGTGDPFDTTGIKSVHWERPSDWVQATVLVAGGPGITGWMIRATVAAIGGAPTSPVVANSKVYTISWPYIDIDDEDVLGDIAARLRIQLRNQSDLDGEGNVPELYYNSVFLGLRRLSRGSDFTAFINLIDNDDFNHNPAGMTVDYNGGIAIATSSLFPTGRYALYNPVGVEALGASNIEVVIVGSLSTEYRGIYRAFVRGYQVGGTLGDITFRIGMTLGVISDPIYSDIGSFSGALSAPEVVDLGLITVDPELLTSDELGTVLFRLDLGNSNVAPPDAALSEIILIPVDEWSGEFSNDLLNIGDRDDSQQLGRYLDIDSVHNPKIGMRAIVKDTPDDLYIGIYNPISAGAMMLQSNSNQRLWMMLQRWDTTGTDHYESQHEIANSIHLAEVIYRYLSMRGAR